MMMISIQKLKTFLLRENRPLSNRLVVVFSSFVAISMLIVTTAVTFVVATVALNDLRDRKLKSVARSGMDLLEQQLSSMVDNVELLSHNHFIINGLIDPSGRERYLPRLIKDCSAQPGIASLAIVDFFGKTIVSSTSQSLNFQTIKELIPVLSVGKSAIFSFGNPKRVLIAEPIEYYNTPQGAVIVEVDLTYWAGKGTFPIPCDSKSLFSFGERIFTKSITDPESHIKFIHGPLRMHPLLQQLGMELEVGLPGSIYMEPVYRIVYIVGGISLVFICIAAFLSRHLGECIARPMDELFSRVERSQHESIRCSPLGTNDEFEALAQAFDRKTDSLIKAEKNYRFLFKENPQPMWVYDLETLRFLAVNENALTHYGYCRDEFMQMTSLDLLSLNDDQVDDFFQCPTEDFEKDNIFFHRRKNGSIIVVDITSHKLDFNGHNAELVVAKDITGQFYAKKALLDSEKEYRLISKQFQTILNGISEPISLINSAMQVVWANTSYGMAVGREPKQLKNQFCHYLWHGETEVCPQCPVKTCFDTGQDVEARVKTPDGKIWFLKAFPMKDLQGNVVNVIEMAKEISEKIRFQREAEQSARLASLGELVVGLAHEINNPCAILSLNISVLKDYFEKILPHAEVFMNVCGPESFKESNSKEILNEIPDMLVDMHDSAIKIAKIIRDLKSFGRIEAIDEYEVLELNEIIKAAVRLTKNELKHATYNFELSLSSSIPRIKASFQQIEQVTINLILNACQSIPDKNCKIGLSTYFDESKGQNVLKITDEGVGINPAILTRIQDPFFTTRRESGGTGLGLSISRKIVENHNGEIHILSEPKKGTQVLVYLPVTREEG